MARLILPSFDPPAPTTQASRDTAATLTEEARLAAFESGYKAGWDDAAAAEAAEQTRIGAELGRNLQALSFTYHEARAEVLRALAPLFEDMVGKLLPQAARAALPALVTERLLPAAAASADLRARITANPAALPALRAAIAPRTDMPLDLQPDATLAEGQVVLRLAGPDTGAGADTTEQRIDVDATIAAIDSAVAAFFAGTAAADAAPARPAEHPPQPQERQADDRHAHG